MRTCLPATLLIATAALATQTLSQLSQTQLVGSAKQSSEMAKLSHAFLGSWRGITPSNPKTNATVENARQTITLGPAGNSLIQEFHGGTDRDPVSGHGVLWWDAGESVYRALWCDSDLPFGCRTPTAGVWEGNDLIFSQQRERQGHRFSSRAAYTDIKPDSFTFSFEIRTDDQPAQRLFTIQYRRQP